MTTKEKKAQYTSENTYSTLNSLTTSTQYAWLAFHGLGYLSKYFIRYFRELNDKNYIICPQAPSKYYQDKSFKYVGASWLTKENTSLEMQNLIRYIDAIVFKEIPEDLPIKLFGYSQGVSIAMRWLASEQRNVSHLIIHSGSIPNELSASDFSLYPNLKVDYIYGRNDEYITPIKLEQQLAKIKELFGPRVHIHTFEGKHEVNSDLILKLSTTKF